MPKGHAKSKPLKFYGLPDLGLADLVPLTGNRDADQLSIEMVCFRIGHRRREGGLGKFGHFKEIVDLCWNNPYKPSPKRFIWCRESEKILRECCRRAELGVAGCSSLGKSDPLALWAVVNYMVDPTHTKVLIMSTTIDGAKMRIWARMREYLDSLPDYPGKPLWSTNRLLGPDYQEKGYSESSGIYLLAGEKAKEKDSLEKLIGIKAPRTGDLDESFEALKRRPEFEHIVARFPDDVLEDLLPRLLEISDERTGRIVFVIDEATGIVESILNAINTNMKPGNPGHIQIVMAGNPNLHWDVFGLFCKPAVGWDHVTLKDYEWETSSGGYCIRFNAEESSRVMGEERCSWMMSKKDIDGIAEEYGRNSLYYYRFVLGMWCPQGADAGVYAQGDIEGSGAMEKAVWGSTKPAMHSHLDPSFAVGGDKASATFFRYGVDPTGKRVMEVVEQVTVKVDVGNVDVPIPYQVLHGWRRECERRKVDPQCASFDSTGGGVTFAAIVRVEWSAKVLPISSGGHASKRPVGREKGPDGERIKADQRFANKATEIWYGAHPFLRSGQIRGLTTHLAREICSRRNDPGGGAKVKVEDKKAYKKREGHSPDDSDSFLGGIEQLRQRHGFRPAERSAEYKEETVGGRVGGPWEVFKARARGITVKGHLRR